MGFITSQFGQGSVKNRTKVGRSGSGATGAIEALSDEPQAANNKATTNND